MYIKRVNKQVGRGLFAADTIRAGDVIGAYAGVVTDPRRARESDYVWQLSMLLARSPLVSPMYQSPSISMIAVNSFAISEPSKLVPPQSYHVQRAAALALERHNGSAMCCVAGAADEQMRRDRAGNEWRGMVEVLAAQPWSRLEELELSFNNLGGCPSAPIASQQLRPLLLEGNLLVTPGFRILQLAVDADQLAALHLPVLLQPVGEDEPWFQFVGVREHLAQKLRAAHRAHDGKRPRGFKIVVAWKFITRSRLRLPPRYRAEH